ncbi:MAG: hypothetical protein OXI73_08345 [Rhodospirillales bacterium]|nr:hypothetical protein [Rhodospirillales bacterium]
MYLFNAFARLLFVEAHLDQLIHECPRRFAERRLGKKYEDVRAIGLVLIGAGTLGLGGLSDLASSAVATLVLGVILWLLSYLRPTAVMEEK